MHQQIFLYESLRCLSFDKGSQYSCTAPHFNRLECLEPLFFETGRKGTKTRKFGRKREREVFPHDELILTNCRLKYVLYRCGHPNSLRSTLNFACHFPQNSAVQGYCILRYVLGEAKQIYRQARGAAYSNFKPVMESSGFRQAKMRFLAAFSGCAVYVEIGWRSMY